MAGLPTILAFNTTGNISQPHLGGDSLFTDREQFRTRPFAKKERFIGPQTTVDFGLQADFYINPETSLIGWIELELTLEAVVPNGDVDPRFDDYLGAAIVRRIQLVHGSDILINLDKGAYLTQNEFGQEYNARWDNMLVGSLSPQQRVDAAKGEQTVRIPIWMFRNQMQHLPTHLINKELIVRVELEPLFNVLSAGPLPPGTPVAPVNSTCKVKKAQLIYDALELTQEEIAEQHQIVTEVDEFTGYAGYVIKSWGYAYIDNIAVPAGETTSIVRLDRKGPFRAIYAFYRDAADYQVPRNITNYQPWVSIRLTGHGQNIVEPRTFDQSLTRYNPKNSHQSTKFGVPAIFYQTWSEMPFEYEHSAGFLGTQAMNDFQLEVTHESPASLGFAGNGRLDVVIVYESHYVVSPSGNIVTPAPL